MFGGFAIIFPVTSVINDVILSLAESFPSASTARLPESNPTTIFKAARIEFPTTATHDALMMLLILF